MNNLYFSNLNMERSIYEFDKGIDTSSYGLTSAHEDIVSSGGVLDTVSGFIRGLISLIRKVLVAVATWIEDRFRKDRSLYSGLVSLNNAVKKIYSKMDFDNKKSANDKIRAMSPKAVWNKADMVDMVEGFNNACGYVSTTLIANIKKDIDNIVEDPTWYSELGELKQVGITADDNGIIQVHQLYEDKSGTMADLGYTDVNTITSVVDSYLSMFNNYSKTQHLVNTIKDLEVMLSTQLRVVQKDMMVAEHIKDNSKNISKAIKFGINMVKSLIPILMNMFTHISRRLQMVLGNVYYALKN